jgi:tripartite-type tricarboxylate transporter receptor subunit TctC
MTRVWAAAGEAACRRRDQNAESKHVSGLAVLHVHHIGMLKKIEWRKRMTLVKRIVTIAAFLVAAFSPAHAQKADPVADFYRGKTIRLIVGYGTGGSYDLYGRLAAEFLGRHIPGNPTIITVNMPGAGGLKAVDYLYKVAPRDGTHLGSTPQQLAMTLLVDDKMGIDPTRFNYLGRLVSMIDVAVAMPKSGLKSFDDARKREVTVGAGQSTSTSAIYARALNVYAGSRFKIVTGYSGTAEIALAAERGEVDVNGGESLPTIIVQNPEWLQGKAVLLYQNGLKRFAQLPNVPTMSELATSEEGKSVMRVLAGTAEVGRSILTTPGVPPERLAALRAAFQAMLKDPQFIAATEKRKVMIDGATGEQIDAITRDTMKLPKDIVAALQRVMQK